MGLSLSKTNITHSAYLYDRGGTRMLAKFTGVSELTYNRTRDAMSTASITIPLKDALGQLQMIRGIEPGRHELRIFRGQDPAWEGPINIPEISFDQVTITANDICFYWDRTAMRQAWSNAGSKADFVVNRVVRIMQAEGARKEALGYNLLGGITPFVQSGDARTASETAAYQSSVFDHFDQLAAKNGIDYTVVNRNLYLWDTSRAALGKALPVSRSDFSSEPTQKKYGTELATTVIATDGQGGFAIAGGTDPYYGEWELLAQAYDEETDSALPTAAELASQAALSLSGRNPTPLELSVPEGTTLLPSAKLQWRDLVPGIWVPLQFDQDGYVATRMQKLQTVTVKEDSKGETIAISLYPASGFTGDDEGIS